MENPSKTHARTALRGPGAGAPQRSTTTWSADHDGIDSLADAMDAGPDAAMPVVPVYEALKHGPAMRVTPLPDRVDQSQLGDAPVPGDLRQAEGHGRGRGGDEAVPRVAERVARDLPERPRDVQGDRLGLERGIRIAKQPEDPVQLVVGKRPSRADHVPEVDDRGDRDGDAVG